MSVLFAAGVYPSRRNEVNLGNSSLLHQSRYSRSVGFLALFFPSPALSLVRSCPFCLHFPCFGQFMTGGKIPDYILHVRDPSAEIEFISSGPRMWMPLEFQFDSQFQVSPSLSPIASSAPLPRLFLYPLCKVISSHSVHVFVQKMRLAIKWNAMFRVWL